MCRGRARAENKECHKQRGRSHSGERVKAATSVVVVFVFVMR